MNLIGKIFTMLILVMSVIFMAFAVAVYATHTNWRDVVTNPETGLEIKLSDAQKLNEKLANDKDILINEVTTQKKSREEAVVKLQNTVAQQQQDIENLDQERNKQTQLAAQLAISMKATHDTLAGLRKEVAGADGNGGLRQEIRTTRADREAAFKQMVLVTEQLHQLQGELDRLKARALELAEDHHKALEVLKVYDLEPEPSLHTGIPPRVDGVVLATAGGGLVEISIGSDDGLQPEHPLEVYRGSKYLGRVEVMKTDPDKAVCKIDPNFKKGVIQKGDRVASKLD